jgi:protein ImuB
MPRRFVSIRFPHLLTDWFSIQQSGLRRLPFVLAAPDHGRMMITAANAAAVEKDINTGMLLADARALVPGLQFSDDKPGLAPRLLKKIAEWCIRYAPWTAIDLPNGIILDASGCAHLWGGEEAYLSSIEQRLHERGYSLQTAIADTIGAAWAMARFGDRKIIPPGKQYEALLPFPPAALRIEADIWERLQKLGLRRISDFIGMPRPALRRRFGQLFLQRIDQALGTAEELIDPVIQAPTYQERLPCLEPIITRTGIEIALKNLLETLCTRLQREEKGLRTACFKTYRVDNQIGEINIQTSRPSHNEHHIFHLFALKLDTIEPALGIELFTLETSKPERLMPAQEKMWELHSGWQGQGFSELIDRLAGRIGNQNIHRYIPEEHHWPERSLRSASSLNEPLKTMWNRNQNRPVQLLERPELIQVAAPIPDYPPMLFRYKNKVHTIKKADGPERIEREWWLEEGAHRDYYTVEDEAGNRYWIFRSGHYGDHKNQWFLHGFFP